MKPEQIIHYLAAHHLTISTAESCTGGLLAARLIDVPGASDVFSEGFITYSNEAKAGRLSVSRKTLETEGAVSAACAGQMAFGAAHASSSDIGISTTGIAGPGGGSADKPVGLVYIGYCIRNDIKTKEFRFKGSRSEVRKQTVEAALTLLGEELKIS